MRSILSILAVTLLLAACGRHEPIRIGLVSNLTGRASDTGTDMRNGVQLAVEELNAQGGIKGRPIELLIRDDEGKPETARKVAQELIGAKVAAIIGHTVSSMTQVNLPLMNDQRMLMLSPTSVSNIFTGKDDYLIRTSPSARQATSQFAQYARGKLGLGSLAIIYDLSNKGYSEDWYNSFKDSFLAAGGKLVGVLPYTTGEGVDYNALAGQLLATKPDGFVLVAGAVDAAMLSQQLRKGNNAQPILIAGWAMTNELLVKGGKAVEGAYISYNFDKDSQAPAYLTFKENFQKRFGVLPNFAAKYGYETVSMLKDGLLKAGDRDSDALKKAIIAQGKFTGLQGDFKIDSFGDAEAQALIFTIRDGAFKRVL